MRYVARYLRHNHIYFVASCLVPVFGVFLYTRIIPLVRTIFWGFTNYQVLNPRKQFIGIHNFLLLLQDQSFLVALQNTVVITVSCVVITLVLAILFAVLLRQIERSSNVFDLLYFVPVVTAPVPASVIWRWLFQYNGLVNVALSGLGLHKQAWLQTPGQVVWAIVVVSIWKWLGYYMIIITVGLKNIPRTYYEASSIDGASAFQQFGRITLPLLRPIVFFSVIMATINFFNTFTIAYVISSSVQGAPSYECKVLVWEIYRNAFSYYRLGYASAEATVLLLFVAIMIFIQFRLLPRGDS